jgi:hypothetical protein
MELAIILTFTYIIPMILTAVVIYHKSNEVTRGDLIWIILVSLVPLFNLFAGYVGGLISLCESKKINDFFNTRIK